MKQYKEVRGGWYLRLEDEFYIPPETDNGDYINMLNLVASGEAEILPADPTPEPTYRELRAIAYRDELGKEQGDFVKTLGDVLDVLILELFVRWGGNNITEGGITDEFKTLLAKVNEIKQRIPKVE